MMELTCILPKYIAVQRNTLAIKNGARNGDASSAPPNDLRDFIPKTNLGDEGASMVLKPLGDRFENQRRTKRINGLYREVWKLFPQCNTYVPALLPCAMSSWQHALCHVAKAS